MGSEAGFRAGSGTTAATAYSRRPPPFFRKTPGLPWLLGLVVIPLLIAAIGYFAFDRPGSANAPSRALPTPAPSSTSAAPKIVLAAFSITRNGNVITLNGALPDDSAKAALIKVLKGSLPADVNVVDQTSIDPNIKALDFSNAVPVFKDSASIADFNLTVDGDTVTLSGTATSQDQKNVVEQEAAMLWSNLNVVDKFVVIGPVPPPGSSGSAPPPPPPAPSPCTDLQAAINAVDWRSDCLWE